MKKKKIIFIIILFVVALVAFTIYCISHPMETSELPEEPENLVSETKPFMTGDGIELSKEFNGSFQKEITKIALESLNYPEYTYVWMKNGASYVNDVPGTYKVYNVTRKDFEENTKAVNSRKVDDGIVTTMDLKIIQNKSRNRIFDTFNRDYKTYPDNLKEIDKSELHGNCDFWDPNDSYFKMDSSVEELGVYGLPMDADYFYFDSKYKTQCSNPKLLKVIGGEFRHGVASDQVVCIYEFDLTTIEHGNKEINVEWFPEAGETYRITFAMRLFADVYMKSTSVEPQGYIILDYEKVENTNN